MAKKVKIKLPKRIAGVKIPKVVRKGPVARFLNSSAGQVILAEALAVAGAALTARNVDADSTAAEVARHPVDSAKRAARRLSSDPRESMERATARLAFALGEGVRAFRAALEHPLPAQAEPRMPDAEGSKKKPPTSPSPQTPH